MIFSFLLFITPSIYCRLRSGRRFHLGALQAGGPHRTAVRGPAGGGRGVRRPADQVPAPGEFRVPLSVVVHLLVPTTRRGDFPWCACFTTVKLVSRLLRFVDRGHTVLELAFVLVDFLGRQPAHLFFWGGGSPWWWRSKTVFDALLAPSTRCMRTSALRLTTNDTSMADTC